MDYTRLITGQIKDLRELQTEMHNKGNLDAGSACEIAKTILFLCKGIEHIDKPVLTPFNDEWK